MKLVNTVEHGVIGILRHVDARYRNTCRWSATTKYDGGISVDFQASSYNAMYIPDVAGDVDYNLSHAFTINKPARMYGTESTFEIIDIFGYKTQAKQKELIAASASFHDHVYGYMNTTFKMNGCIYLLHIQPTQVLMTKVTDANGMCEITNYNEYIRATQVINLEHVCKTLEENKIQIDMVTLIAEKVNMYYIERLKILPMVFFDSVRMIMSMLEYYWSYSDHVFVNDYGSFNGGTVSILLLAAVSGTAEKEQALYGKRYECHG